MAKIGHVRNTIKRLMKENVEKLPKFLFQQTKAGNNEAKELQNVKLYSLILKLDIYDIFSV